MNGSETAGEWGPKAVPVEHANLDTSDRAALGYITSEVRKDETEAIALTKSVWKQTWKSAPVMYFLG